MIRLQTPLIGNEIKDDIPYVVLYDEIFVGFGEMYKQIFLTKIELVSY